MNRQKAHTYKRRTQARKKEAARRSMCLFTKTSCSCARGRVSPSFCLSVSRSLNLSVFLFLCLVVSLSLCLSCCVSLSCCLAVSLSHCLTVSPSLCLRGADRSFSLPIAFSLSHSLAPSLSRSLILRALSLYAWAHLVVFFIVAKFIRVHGVGFFLLLLLLYSLCVCEQMDSTRNANTRGNSNEFRPGGRLPTGSRRLRHSSSSNPLT